MDVEAEMREWGEGKRGREGEVQAAWGQIRDGEDWATKNQTLLSCKKVVARDPNRTVQIQSCPLQLEVPQLPTLLSMSRLHLVLLT